MEPFALQSSSPGLIRPTIDLQSDLSAVLREGRVLSGEVLQTMDGESLLIGVGRHKVPARAQVKMEPGHRFLFQVQREGDTVVLRVLGTGSGRESDLLRALRAVVGQDQPMGELLARLAGVLRSTGTAVESGGLLEQLLTAIFRPGQDGGELAARLSTGGLAYEARLARTALDHMPPARLQVLGRELLDLLLADLVRGAVDLDEGSFELALRAALRELLAGGDAARLEDGIARWTQGVQAENEPLPRELIALLRRALARADLPRSAGMQVLANLAGVDLAALGRGLQELILRTWVGAPRADVPTGGLVGDLELLGSDLKARLLRALGELPEGTVREAVSRTLAGLEAEQLLNLARGRSHEALHWSLPVPDGERWTTAHLFFRPTQDGEGGAATGASGVRRVTVAIDFSHTGPVRADLALRPGALAMRVLVSRVDVAERLGAELGELEQRLALGGRRVSLVVGVAPPEEVRVDLEAQDIRFLRENHMMDTSG